MQHIYIALVDTPGLFASLIRHFLKQKYIHVVIAADAELSEAYSVGRRFPEIPLLAGFEREDKQRILRAFPTASYCVCELECSSGQKERIFAQLKEDYRRRLHIHYAVPGLLFIALGIPFFIRDQYTCSSYIARLLQENGISVSDKHFSLVTPKDFCEYGNKRVVFEGRLSELVKPGMRDSCAYQ